MCRQGGDHSCGHLDWCPELNRCIPPWGETCPIQSDVEFAGGTRLSCRKGARCAAPQDNKCSWYWGPVVIDTPVHVDVNGPPLPPLPPGWDRNITREPEFATYYWADLGGHFTIPEGCSGIKCDGCHRSEDDSWADRWRMYRLDRRDDPLDIAVDAAVDSIGFLLPCVVVAVCFWRCGMRRKMAPRRIRQAITRSVGPALNV